MTRKLSLSKAWDESKVIFARESRLLIAVSLALVGIPVTVANFATPMLQPGTVPAAGSWIVIVLIALVLVLAGLLAVVRLAVGSGESVGGAIRLSFVRLPAFVATVILVLIPFLFVAAALNLLIASGDAARAQQTALGALVLLLFIFGPLLSRFLLTPPVAVAQNAGPVTQIRRSWTLTRGNGLRLFGALLLIAIAIAIIEFAFGIAFGSIILIIFGAPEPQSVSKLLIALILGLLRSVEMVVVGVMLARLYVQAAGDAPAEVTVPHSGS